MKRLVLPAILLFLVSYSCEIHEKEQPVTEVGRDLDAIREKGALTVITDYSSTDYYIFKGQPLGYQYELLQNLAEHLGVRLEISVSHDLDESFRKLENGDVDLIAQNLTITNSRRNLADFTVPLIQTRQVLVQRKPANWLHMSANEIENNIITNPVDLGGKTVYIMKGSAYGPRLANLSDEIGDSIQVVEMDENVEKLIEKVASGEIDYTVCDEVFAQVNSMYYPDLDVSVPVSLQQNVAWAVHKGSDHFLNELNIWLRDFKQTSRYKSIYAKYFSKEKPSSLMNNNYYAINSGIISPFDDYIRQYSEIVGWDWRLLTSLIYQESRFQVNAISWAGAFGIMQLMPGTASRFGVMPESSPREQIRAGVQFIKWLDDHFKDIKDPNERIKFILAAYNVGPGHIDDARALARKNHSDPNVWQDSVAKYLLAKSNPEVYNDPVVKYGYCNGQETYRYVTEVLDRYQHYKNVVPESN